MEIYLNLTVYAVLSDNSIPSSEKKIVIIFFVEGSIANNEICGCCLRWTSAYCMCVSIICMYVHKFETT